MRWFKLEDQDEQLTGKFSAIPKLMAEGNLVIRLPNGIRVEYEGQLTQEQLQLLQSKPPTKAILSSQKLL